MTEDLYQIYVATYSQWVLEGETRDREIARTTVRSLRSRGHIVAILRNGKKVNWRIK